MIYLIIENNNLVSVCDYEPNVGDDDVQVIKYSGKIPKERILYIDGKIKDSDNYLFLNGKYVSKNKSLELQVTENHDARSYLVQTDWLVIRHRDQVDLGLETSLSDDEYRELLEKRQTAREKVVDYDG